MKTLWCSIAIAVVLILLNQVSALISQDIAPKIIPAAIVVPGLDLAQRS